MKKITLTVLIIFLLFIGSIFIRNQFDQKNKASTNTPLLNTRLNSPNIDISNLQSNSISSQPGSFIKADVIKHHSKNDCYLIINNKVYDISSYISGGYHPAGSRIIISYCGKEITGIFARIHSNRAWDLLANYKIGTIATNKQNATPQILTAVSNALKKANPNAKILKVSPKTNFYIAKIIFNGKFYEIHINNAGKIFKEEVENNEINWLLWEDDYDDN